MSIFKNLSNQEKRKAVKRFSKYYKIGDHIACDFPTIIWESGAETEYKNLDGFPEFPELLKKWNIEKWNKVETDITKEKAEKAVKISKLILDYERENAAIKVGTGYYNADFIRFGFCLLNPAKITFKEMPAEEKETPNGVKYINTVLLMSDDEINYVIMPIRTTKSKFNPDAITAEDVEKARKYKVYLEGKAKYEKTEYYHDTKNMIVKKGNYFVAFSRDNEFLNRVFNFNPDTDENFDGAAGDFEFDPEQHKNTEDLFHKKITYFKNITHGNFWHFYENGTGVCFTA